MKRLRCDHLMYDGTMDKASVSDLHSKHYRECLIEVQQGPELQHSNFSPHSYGKWAGLADCLLNIIFEHSNHRDLVSRIELTCRSWHKTATLSGSLWKTILVSERHTTWFNQWIKSNPRRYNSTRRLCISNQPRNKIASPLPMSIVDHFSFIHELQLIIRYKDNCAIDALEQLSRLEKFNLRLICGEQSKTTVRLPAPPRLTHYSVEVQKPEMFNDFSYEQLYDPHIYGIKPIIILPGPLAHLINFEITEWCIPRVSDGWIAQSTKKLQCLQLAPDDSLWSNNQAILAGIETSLTELRLSFVTDAVIESLSKLPFRSSLQKLTVFSDNISIDHLRGYSKLTALTCGAISLYNNRPTCLLGLPPLVSLLVLGRCDIHILKQVVDNIQTLQNIDEHDGKESSKSFTRTSFIEHVEKEETAYRLLQKRQEDDSVLGEEEIIDDNEY